MKKIIRIMTLLFTLFNVTVISATGVPSPEYKPIVNDSKITVEGNDNLNFKESSNGGIVIKNIKDEYSKEPLTDKTTSHTTDEYQTFVDLILNEVKAYGGILDLAVYDIHTWGNMINETPTSFTVYGDVSPKDNVEIFHFVNGKVVKISENDFVVSDGSITVNNISSLSLWGFSKIGFFENKPNQNEVKPETNNLYVPPRTDVK